MTKEDIFFEAMRTRDSRFDGKFFVGVKTTGIYCRPICPAKPKRENVEFFTNSHEAEKSGYRPCLRCRPESAPLSPAWIGKSAVVQRAVKALSTRDIVDFDEEQFAERFGVSARHLRRLFVEEIGKTPKQLVSESRLNLARKLIVETSLSMTEIAFASGFESIRRFNDAFKDRFKRAPREIRRNNVAKGEGLQITLAYRPPFDFDGLLRSYQNHRIGRLEWFSEGKMHRIVAIGEHIGTIVISNVPEKSSLLLEIDFPDTSMIHVIVSKVRSLFDLDSDPVVIANALESHKDLKKIWSQFPGIRLPSGWDAFEVAVSAILGQLVSVERGRNLVNDLIEICGRESEMIFEDQKIKLFPMPEDLACADLTNLKTTGIRKQTLRLFAEALVKGEISLDPTQDVDQFIEKVTSIKGIGPWTAQYMALKVLRHTDTFPASDLILARALELHPEAALEKISPWRGYAAALLWRHYTGMLKKSKTEKKK